MTSRRRSSWAHLVLAFGLVVGALALTGTSSEVRHSVRQAAVSLTSVAGQVPTALAATDSGVRRVHSTHLPVSAGMLTLVALVTLLVAAAVRRRIGALAEGQTRRDGGRGPPAGTAVVVPVGIASVLMDGRRTRSNRAHDVNFGSHPRA